MPSNKSSRNGAPHQPTKIRKGLKHLLVSIEAKKKCFMTMAPGGRQAMLTVLEIGTGVESLSKAKSKSWVFVL